VLLGRFAGLGDDRGERNEEAGVFLLHVFVVVPRGQVLAEQDRVWALHALATHGLCLAVSCLVGFRNAVQRDRVACDVLAGVVQVYVEVLETALV